LSGAALARSLDDPAALLGVAGSRAGRAECGPMVGLALLRGGGFD
jgi:hypothetical protein